MEAKIPKLTFYVLQPNFEKTYVFYKLLALCCPSFTKVCNFKEVLLLFTLRITAEPRTTLISKQGCCLVA